MISSRYFTAFLRPWNKKFGIGYFTDAKSTILLFCYVRFQLHHKSNRHYTIVIVEVGRLWSATGDLPINSISPQAARTNASTEQVSMEYALT